MAPERAWAGLRVLSVAPLLAEVIQRIHSGISVDTIFRRRNPALG
jgi:ribose-phosphate pyrophosphokinase